MLVLLGESGVGKTTIEDILINKYGFTRAISHTTRTKRGQDVDGVNYFFVSFDEMERLHKSGDLVERVEYIGNIYGYVREQCLPDRVAVVIPDGLRQLVEKPNLDVFSIYLKSSEDVRRDRMLGRGDSIEAVDSRLENDRVVFEGVADVVNLIIDNTDKSIDEIVELVLNGYNNRLNKG